LALQVRCIPLRNCRILRVIIVFGMTGLERVEV
jgi:hypothetical protein